MGSLQPGIPDDGTADADEATRIAAKVRTRRRIRGVKGKRVSYDAALNVILDDFEERYGEDVTVEDLGGEKVIDTSEQRESVTGEDDE